MRVQICKEIAALSIRGGYLLFGVSDTEKDAQGSAKICDLTDEQVKCLDEATIRDKFCRYFPNPGDMIAKCFSIEGKKLVVLLVEPCPAGFLIALKDIHDPSSGRFLLRKGEVYARHGSKSERWDQSDIPLIKEILNRDAIKKRSETLTEYAVSVKESSDYQKKAAGPISQLHWTLDQNTLDKMLLEQIRAGDTVPLLHLLEKTQRETEERLETIATDTVSEQECKQILEFYTTALVLTARYGSGDIYSVTVKHLRKIYGLGFDECGNTRFGSTKSVPMLWHQIGIEIFGVGAYLVRQELWEKAKELILQPLNSPNTDHYPNWLRHSITMAARNDLTGIQQKEGNLLRRINMIWQANELVNKQPFLRPEFKEGDERVLDSVCQFSLLFCVIALYFNENPDDRAAYYTDFAYFYDRRIETLATQLVTDQNMREVLGLTDLSRLASVLLSIQKAARQEGFSYDFDSLGDKANMFISKHTTPDQARN